PELPPRPVDLPRLDADRVRQLDRERRSLRRDGGLLHRRELDLRRPLLTRPPSDPEPPAADSNCGDPPGGQRDTHHIPRLTQAQAAAERNPSRLIAMEPSLPVAERPRRPEWMKVRAPSADSRYFDVKKLIHGAGLHTICEEAD